MVEPLRPSRGGFLRPFGCAWFVREFLAGNAPNGSRKTDPEVGSPQSEIFREYKLALSRATAMDRAISLEEKRARKEGRLIDPDKITDLADQFLARMPYKGQGARYHSFVVYFSTIQRLGWVEFSGREEPSEFQDHYDRGQPRRYYRLTVVGKAASDAAWANPQVALYG